MPCICDPPGHCVPITATSAQRQVVGQATPASAHPPQLWHPDLLSLATAHTKKNVMQIMMDYMKIIQRMLSTSFTGSCQNILPSSFLTHHFQASLLILQTRTVPHHVSCKRVKNFLKRCINNFVKILNNQKKRKKGKINSEPQQIIYHNL